MANPARRVRGAGFGEAGSDLFLDRGFRFTIISLSIPTVVAVESLRAHLRDGNFCARKTIA